MARTKQTARKGARTDTAPTPARSTTLPSTKEDKKDDTKARAVVQGLAVADLRKHLGQFGLATTGMRKALQERLIAHMTENNIDELSKKDDKKEEKKAAAPPKPKRKIKKIVDDDSESEGEEKEEEKEEEEAEDVKKTTNKKKASPKSKLKKVVEEEEEEEEDAVLLDSDEEEDEEEEEEEEETIVWQWADDGPKGHQDLWRDYGSTMQKKLEAAYTKKAKQQRVDTQRFVDLSSDPYLQCRYDDPTRRRLVQRKVVRTPVKKTTTTIKKKASAPQKKQASPKSKLKKVVEEEEEEEEDAVLLDSDEEEDDDDEDDGTVEWLWAGDSPGGGHQVRLVL